MIRLRTSLTIERRRQLEIPLKPDGQARLVVKPREADQEYVTLVLGTVERGEMVGPVEILKATRNLLDQLGEECRWPV